MPAHRKGRVFKVILVPPDEAVLFPSPPRYIEEALSTGSSIERYSREWIVGRTTRERYILSGRIGFRGAEGMAEVWDDEAKDFREVAVPAGLTAPFAVNLRTFKMALQPRGSLIKLNGLIGAFRALLAQGGDQWRIRTPEKEISFPEWRASVDRVVSARFRLKKPNPHWEGAPDLEAVMEQAEAEVAVLELSADDGIDTESPFVKQSQVHVDRGYGEARYVGERRVGASEVHETVYNSDLGSEEDSVEVGVGDDGEVALDDLVATLDAEEGAQQTGDDGEQANRSED